MPAGLLGHAGFRQQSLWRFANRRDTELPVFGHLGVPWCCEDQSGRTHNVSITTPDSHCQSTTFGIFRNPMKQKNPAGLDPGLVGGPLPWPGKTPAACPDALFPDRSRVAVLEDRQALNCLL